VHLPEVSAPEIHLSGFVTDADGGLAEHLKYIPGGETWVQEKSIQPVPHQWHRENVAQTRVQEAQAKAAERAKYEMPKQGIIQKVGNTKPAKVFRKWLETADGAATVVDKGQVIMKKDAVEKGPRPKNPQGGFVKVGVMVKIVFAGLTIYGAIQAYRNSSSVGEGIFNAVGSIYGAPEWGSIMAGKYGKQIMPTPSDVGKLDDAARAGSTPVSIAARSPADS
jgi:hypothetical protein